MKTLIIILILICLKIIRISYKRYKLSGESIIDYYWDNNKGYMVLGETSIVN
tara:strand:+ start:2942 stop:3097 length:156 start_codon:yes stop_codon:yes gene_type:complete